MVVSPRSRRGAQHEVQQRATGVRCNHRIVRRRLEMEASGRSFCGVGRIRRCGMLCSGCRPVTIK
jgi:hypothetical protein